MTESQKQLIREKWRNTTEMANHFTYYVKMSGSRELNADAIADFWLNELDLAIKQTEERLVEIIRNENYKLEEWYSSAERPREITHFDANQKNMETRNKILNLIRNK